MICTYNPKVWEKKKQEGLILGPFLMTQGVQVQPRLNITLLNVTLDPPTKKMQLIKQSGDYHWWKTLA